MVFYTGGGGGGKKDGNTGATVQTPPNVAIENEQTSARLRQLSNPSIQRQRSSDRNLNRQSNSVDEIKSESSKLSRRLPMFLKIGFGLARSRSLSPKKSSKRSRASTLDSATMARNPITRMPSSSISSSPPGLDTSTSGLDFEEDEADDDGSPSPLPSASPSSPPSSFDSGKAKPRSRGSFFFATGKRSPTSSDQARRSSGFGILGNLTSASSDDIVRAPRLSSSLQETLLERFEHAEELRLHRNTKQWCYWGMSKEHKELDFIRNWKTRLITRTAGIRQTCRHGSLDSAERRSAWLSMGGVNVISNTFRNSISTYEYIFKNQVAACAGCQDLHMNHLHTFGARFLRNGGVLWTENLFDKHLLSKDGIKCAKRLLLVLHAKWSIEHCPELPDLVCICLLYMTELETFAVIDGILKRSRESKRWVNDADTQSNPVILPVGKADALVFVRTFVSLFKERLPALHRNLEDLARDSDELEHVFLTWFERFYVGVFPLRFVVRIFDCYMVEGPKVLYRIGLTLLSNARSQLLGECAKRKRGEVAISEVFDSSFRSVGIFPDHQDQHSRSAVNLTKESNAVTKSKRINRKRSSLPGSQGENAEANATSRPSLRDLFGGPGQGIIDNFIDNDDIDDEEGVSVHSDSSDKSESDQVEKPNSLFPINKALSQSFSGKVSEGGGFEDEDLDREEGLLSPRSPWSQRSSTHDSSQNITVPKLSAKEKEVDDFEDTSSPLSPRFLKSVQLEPTMMIDGGKTSAEYNIAINNLTLRTRRHSAPRHNLLMGGDYEAPNPDPKENQVIVVEKRYGSKAFYSESSLFKSDTAAGAALMERMFGTTDVSTTRYVQAPQQDSFEFKVFLASAFSWRKLYRKTLAKRDEINRRAVFADPFARISDPIPQLHFPHRLLQDSTILNNVDAATQLISWLPLKVQLKVFRHIRLIYTTNRDGRSLSSLYEACEKSKLTNMILLLECIPHGNASREGESKRQKPTVIGAFSSSALILPRRSRIGFHGDDNCFLFRLEPKFASKSWKPPSVALASVMAVSQVSNKLEQSNSRQKSGGSLKTTDSIRQGSVRSADLLSQSDSGKDSMFSRIMSMRSFRTVISSESSNQSPINSPRSPSTPPDGAGLRQRGEGAPASNISASGKASRISQSQTLISLPMSERLSFLSEGFDEVTQANESSSRTRFVTCGPKSIEFGGRSYAFVTKHGKRITREEINDISDDQFLNLQIRTELAGPGLALDNLLDNATTSWCSAYDNRPLCMSTDVIPGLSDDLIRTFRIGQVEVFGV